MQSAMPDNLDDLRARFCYRSEESDHWTLLASERGYLRGDCDDFALTALWVLCGRSWLQVIWQVLTFNMLLWNVRTRAGVPHMALWVRGRGWICNMYPTWGASQHSLSVPYILPLFLIGLVIKYRGRSRPLHRGVDRNFSRKRHRKLLELHKTMVRKVQRCRQELRTPPQGMRVGLGKRQRYLNQEPARSMVWGFGNR